MYRFFKRVFDVILAALALIVLSPIMLVTAILVKLTSPGEIIFKQDRLGMGAKVFKMYKFRSMCVGAEKMGVYSDSTDARVTKVGKIIRATSIDELPQLVNIIKGDMSFVGPRPPLTYHPWPIEEYSQQQMHMFDTRPGITGWAQINGRKDVEWNQRIEYNCWYIDHMSLFLDIKIIILTFFKVLKNEDNANTTETVIKDNKEDETN